MSDYKIVSADDVEDAYAGTDVPGEFRRLTAALESEQLAVTLIRVPPHSDFEQGTGHYHDEVEVEAILASVRRTRRALVVDEGWRSGSLSAEIIARIVEQAFYDLDAPPARVCSLEVPIPYAKHLEEAALPQVPGIVAAAKGLLG